MDSKEQIKRFEEKYEGELEEDLPLVFKREVSGDDFEVCVKETRLLPRVNADNIIKSNKKTLDFINKSFNNMKSRRDEMKKAAFAELNNTLKDVERELKNINELSEEDYFNLALAKLDEYVDGLKSKVESKDKTKEELKERIRKIFEEEKLNLENKRKRAELELEVYSSLK